PLFLNLFLRSKNGDDECQEMGAFLGAGDPLHPSISPNQASESGRPQKERGARPPSPFAVPPPEPPLLNLKSVFAQQQQRRQWSTAGGLLGPGPQNRYQPCGTPPKERRARPRPRPQHRRPKLPASAAPRAR